MLLYTWNKTAELYCDNSVIKNKTNKEIEEYGTLIIDLATTASYSENRIPIAGLNLNKRHHLYHHCLSWHTNLNSLNLVNMFLPIFGYLWEIPPLTVLPTQFLKDK